MESFCMMRAVEKATTATGTTAIGTTGTGTGTTAIGTTATGTAATRTVLKKRWCCDVCKCMYFDDFDQACHHEETCTGIAVEGGMHVPTLTLTSTSVSKAAPVPTISSATHPVVQKKSKSTGRRTKSSKAPFTAPFTAPSTTTSTASAAAAAAAKNPKRTQTQTGGGTREVSPEGSPRTKNSKRPTSRSRASSSTITATSTSTTTSTSSSSSSTATTTKCASHSFFAPRAPAAAVGTATNKRVSPTARTNKRQQSKKLKTMTSKKLPQQQKQDRENDDDDNDDDKVILDVDGSASTHRKSCISCSSSSDMDEDVMVVELSKPSSQSKRRQNRMTKVVTLEDAEETANAPAALINAQAGAVTAATATFFKKQKPNKANKPTKSSAPLAGLFATSGNDSTATKSMKALIAEQRQAEFQAKRRLARQQEQARQQRKQTVTQEQEPRLSLAPRSKAVATTATTIALTSTSALPAHCRMPLAPRFPVPNHVIPDHDETATSTSIVGGGDDDDESEHYWMDVTATYTSSCSSSNSNPSTATPPSPPPAALETSLISSPSALDAVEDTRDLVQEALACVLMPKPSSSSLSSSSSSDSRLWSDVYGLHHNRHSLVGASTRQAADTLQGWIQEWCVARHAAMERMKKRQRNWQRRTTIAAAQTRHTKRKGLSSTSSKTNYKEDSEYEDDEDDWGTAMGNVYLLTGPPASGKTALVHAVAQACQCTVLELNTTTPRSATALKHKIQEATQSCSTTDLFQQQQQQQSSLLQSLHEQQRQVALQDSDSEHDDDDGEEEKDKKKGAPQASLTVILIDEVDLIYESQGDSGFWTALTSVAKTARCPIFLTCTQRPTGLSSSLQHHHLHLQRPTPDECADKILQVCQAEQLGLQSALDPQIVRQRLAHLATVCHCDLRRLLFQLQLYATTGAAVAAHAASILTDNQTAFPDSSNASTIPSTTSIQQRPHIQSIAPHRVPSDKYSIVTLHGRHFHSLLETVQPPDQKKKDVVVHIGTQVCPGRILDDDTILVLCPPCCSHLKSHRIVPVFLESTTKFGRLEGCSVEAQSLVDGDSLPATRRLWLEYLCFDEEEEEDECEFDDETAARASNKPSKTLLPTVEDGMTLWNKTLAEEDTGMELEPHTVVSAVKPNHDPSICASLDQLAETARWSSDAAVLEDWQGGYPFLAGACRGFGYDLTEEGGSSMGDGKLRMNDNCRPPNEDRLFTLGWNDNCFFHGEPETYMTLPNTSQERCLLKSCVQSSRGEKARAIDLEISEVPDKEEEVSEDLEDVVRRDSSIVEEDMFLLRTMPILLESLPQLLRMAGNHASAHHHCTTWISNQVLAQRRHEQTQTIQGWISAMFDQFLQANKRSRPPSRELLLLNMKMDDLLVTEFLPTFRRIAAIERSLESLEDDSGNSSLQSRRATRSNARNSRKHYFDKLSRKMELDQGTISTSKLGQEIAETFLRFEKQLTGSRS